MNIIRENIGIHDASKGKTILIVFSRNHFKHGCDNTKNNDIQFSRCALNFVYVSYFFWVIVTFQKISLAYLISFGLWLRPVFLADYWLKLRYWDWDYCLRRVVFWLDAILVSISNFHFSEELSDTSVTFKVPKIPRCK